MATRRELENFRKAIASDPDIIQNHPEKIPEMIEQRKANMRNWKQFFPSFDQHMAEIERKKKMLQDQEKWAKLHEIPAHGEKGPNSGTYLSLPPSQAEQTSSSQSHTYLSGRPEAELE